MTQPNEFGVYPTIDPAGRISFTSLSAVDADRYLFTPERKELFNQLEIFVESFREVFCIRAIWIGGSFLTSKPIPGDIDTTILIDGDKVNSLIAAEDPLLNFLDPGFLNGFLKDKQLRIDAYFLTWRPLVAEPKNGIDGSIREYHEGRGYWDDWWQRQRQGSKDDAPDVAWAAPRQGYLEVIVNGYI